MNININISGSGVSTAQRTRKAKPRKFVQAINTASYSNDMASEDLPIREANTSENAGGRRAQLKARFNSMNPQQKQAVMSMLANRGSKASKRKSNLKKVAMIAAGGGAIVGGRALIKKFGKKNVGKGVAMALIPGAGAAMLAKKVFKKVKLRRR